LKEATTFPLIILFVPGHEAYTQMSFFPKTPKLADSQVGGLQIVKIGIPTTLEAHNFFVKNAD